MGSSPEPPPMLVDASASMWIKRLSCHADLYTVSRCHTRGESEDHTGKKVWKGSTLALKLRADITRSPKQGYQWPYEKDLCPPKKFKEKHNVHNNVHNVKYLMLNVSKILHLTKN